MEVKVQVVFVAMSDVWSVMVVVMGQVIGGAPRCAFILRFSCQDVSVSCCHSSPESVPFFHYCYREVNGFGGRLHNARLPSPLPPLSPSLLIIFLYFRV